jgi:hypothetical protein
MDEPVRNKMVVWESHISQNGKLEMTFPMVVREIWVLKVQNMHVYVTCVISMPIGNIRLFYNEMIV